MATLALGCLLVQGCESATSLEPHANVEAGSAAATQPAPASDGQSVPQAIFPGVIMNREAGYVDLAATVVGREVEWLELLACSPGSREHESIVTIDAKASHLMTALLLLGLEPGSPMSTKREGEALQVVPPTGPRVAVVYVLDGQEGEPVPANAWIISQETGEVMQGDEWIFAGSRFTEFDGKRWFLAQENGTLISLVNFGDDLLCRDTTQSDAGGNGLWTANTPAIPPTGTRLTVRLTPVDLPASQ